MLKVTEARQEIARHLREYKIEDIAKCTNLTVEEIMVLIAIIILIFFRLVSKCSHLILYK